jgi:hypothetical protein
MNPSFCGVCVAPSLFFSVLFCRSLIVLLSFFSLPLYYLFFFDLLVLVIPLVSSNFSYVLSLLTRSFIHSFCHIILSSFFTVQPFTSIFYYLFVCSRRDYSYIIAQVLLSINQCIWIALRISSTNKFQLIMILFNCAKILHTIYN